MSISCITENARNVCIFCSSTFKFPEVAVYIDINGYVKMVYDFNDYTMT